jgi:hypothetical protein
MRTEVEEETYGKVAMWKSKKELKGTGEGLCLR